MQGHYFMGKYYYTKRGKIKKIRNNCLTICIPATDYKLPAKYYNISFDEIFSDDWKEKELETHKQIMKQKKETEENQKQKKLAEKEAWERKEYERLKEKFEK